MMVNRSDREEVSLNDLPDFESLEETRPSSADFHQGHREQTPLYLSRPDIRLHPHPYASRAKHLPNTGGVHIRSHDRPHRSSG
jgi:hypothetical protein